MEFPSIHLEKGMQAGCFLLISLIQMRMRMVCLMEALMAFLMEVINLWPSLERSKGGAI